VYDGETVQDPVLKRKVVSISEEIKGYFASRGLPVYTAQFDGRSDYAPFMENDIPAGGVFTGADAIKTVEEAQLYGGVAGVVLDRNCP
jgi:Zn-dependent M28 family amino/carboxypeptidase